MSARTPALHRTTRWILRSLPLGILVVGLLGTAWFTYQTNEVAARHDEDHFNSLRADSLQAIAARVQSYEDVLGSGSAMFAASEEVTRAEWQAYAGRLALDERYAGVRGYGVVFVVPEWKEQAFEVDQQATWPGFAIHPVPGFEIGRGDRYVITYLAPEGGNQPAIGLDVATEPVRREALERARDTGEPAISGRIHLAQVQGDAPAFLLAMPIYRGGRSPETVAERRAAIDGWIYAPFVTAEFLQTVLGSKSRELDMHVYDAAAPDPASLVFDSDGDGRQDGVSYQTFALGGQPFTVGFERSSEFQAANRTPTVAMGLFGVITSVALALMVFSLTRSRENAHAAAEAARAELRSTVALQRAIVENAAQAIITTDRHGLVTSFNPAAEAMLGWRASEVVGQVTPARWHRIGEVEEKGLALAAEMGISAPPAEAAYRAMAVMDRPFEAEFTYVHRDGHEFSCWLSTSPLRNEAGRITGFVTIARDITLEKRVHQAEELLAAVVGASADAILSLDPEGRITSWNHGAEQLYGYSAGEALGMPAIRLLPPGRLPEAAAIREAITRGEDTHLESERLRKDGTTVPVLSTHSPLRNAAGEIVGSASVVRDISEQVAARQQLEEALEVLQANSFILSEQAAELDALRSQAEYLADHDGLTGVLNRRAWLREAAARPGTSMAILDIDFFKSVNDTHGHPAGDAVLAEVARRMSEAAAPGTVLGRFGGEEFAMVLYAEPALARASVEACMAAVAGTPIALPEGGAITITLSAGFAPWAEGAEALNQTYFAADQALYRAKEGGRRRLVAA